MPIKKRKIAKKSTLHKHRQNSSVGKIFWIRYIIFAVLITALAIGAKNMMSGRNVLGNSTGPTKLAEQSPNEQPENPEGQNHPQNPNLTPQQPQQKIELQSEGFKKELNIQTPSTHIEIKREDNGNLNISSHQEDGSQTQLQKDALEKLNEDLKNEDMEVATSTSSSNTLILRKDGVEAQTNFPLSVNPTTHQLTINTPTGEKTVTILPDQAVKNLLDNKLLTNVETQISSQSGTSVQQATLTELNNQPVFQVNGTLQKKVLGLLPVDLNKTAFVSATNGQVIQVNEDLLTRLLDALSF